jgi:excisionase family DNA binding protein
MKSHSQLDVRENTASRRQHASRSAVLAVPRQSTSTTTEDDVSLISVSSQQELSATVPNNAAHTAATESDERHENHLLTVRDVADLLQVPASWVYGRTRKRSSERIPGYRLGKYWRFRHDEVLAWVESQRRGSNAA